MCDRTVIITPDTAVGVFARKEYSSREFGEGRWVLRKESRDEVRKRSGRVFGRGTGKRWKQGFDVAHLANFAGMLWVEAEAWAGLVGG